MNDEPTHQDIQELERMLEAERPIPTPNFRGELRRHLLVSGARPVRSRIRLLVGAYAGSGAALLLIAGVGIAGAGPFAA